MKSLKINPPNKVEDGAHEGVIKELVYNDVNWNGKDLEYLNFTIELDNGQRVFTGFNSYITPDTKLGKLFDTFGANLNEEAFDTDLDPENFFLNKKVKFMTVTNKKGFTEVVENSLKPIK